MTVLVLELQGGKKIRMSPPPPPKVIKFGIKPSGPFLFPYLTYIDIEVNEKKSLTTL